MNKSLVVSRKLVVVGAVCLAAVVAVAAPKLGRPVIMHQSGLTNSYKIGGVMFPPLYTQELFRQREELITRYREDMKRIEAEARRIYDESLTDTHRKILQEISRQQEEEIGRRNAEAAARNAELVAITNRKAYIVKEYHEKRRSEYHYRPKSLYWLKDEVFKETVTRAEKGKVVIHILYTRGKDGKEKRHRYNPLAIERRLAEAAEQDERAKAKGGVK